jgi:hypothetical protein
MIKPPKAKVRQFVQAKESVRLNSRPNRDFLRVLSSSIAVHDISYVDRALVPAGKMYIA